MECGNWGHWGLIYFQYGTRIQTQGLCVWANTLTKLHPNQKLPTPISLLPSFSTPHYLLHSNRLSLHSTDQLQIHDSVLIPLVLRLQVCTIVSLIKT